MVEREQTECAADYIAPLAEGVEGVAERLSIMRDALGGLAIWAAHKQGSQLRGIAEDLERIARYARSIECELNDAAAEYHASLTPDFGEIRYNRLCNLAAIKRPKDGMGRRTKEIVIVDDTTIKSDKGYVVLSADEIAVLNKATKHRQWHLSASDLRANVPNADGGERSMQQSEFRLVYSSLVAKLKLIAGEPLFACVGGGSRIVYVLSPVIQFVDERATQPPEAVVIAENAEGGDGEERIRVPDEPSVTPPSDVLPKSHKPNMSKPEAAKRVIDTWRSVDEIALATGLPSGIIALFIDRNRSRLGSDFKFPQMRARPHPTASGKIFVQCYSPQFSDWAIASLEAAKLRLAEQQDADHATPES